MGCRNLGTDPRKQERVQNDGGGNLTRIVHPGGKLSRHTGRHPERMVGVARDQHFKGNMKVFVPL
eukprot:10682642-Karenia_brevis.AAC.1